MTLSPSLAALWSIKASWASMLQNVSSQFKLIFADFSKNYSKPLNATKTLIFPLHFNTEFQKI